MSAFDGSAGWCLMIASQNSAFAGFLPADAAHELWGNGGIVAGVARANGRAVAHGDSYTAGGRWPFASGSSHADWFVGECIVENEDGTPKLDASGNGESVFVAAPRAAVTLHDTWYTQGLRGTASNDFSFEGLRIEARRTFSSTATHWFETRPVDPWPLYRAPLLIFTTHGGHALGLARAAITAGAEVVKTKLFWGGAPMSELPRVQTVFAEATAEVESARAFLYDSADMLWASLERGENDALLRSRVRLATSHAATASLHAVDLIHRALATTAVFTSSPVERIFRDMHTAAAHVMVGPVTYENAGRVELGLAAQMPFF